MKNYSKLVQSLENEYEAQQLNDFYNQEEIEWKPITKSQKQIKLEKIRKNYYKFKKFIKIKERFR